MRGLLGLKDVGMTWSLLICVTLPAEKEPEGSFVETQKTVLKTTYLVQSPCLTQGKVVLVILHICHRSLHVPHQQWTVDC